LTQAIIYLFILFIMKIVYEAQDIITQKRQTQTLKHKQKKKKRKQK